MDRIGVASPVFVLSILTACRGEVPTPNQDPLPDLRGAAEQVVLCETADSTLRRTLGPPTREGLLHDERVLSWLDPSSSPTRYLAVLRDSKGTVVDIYWDIPTEVPWVPTNQCVEGER